MFLNWLILTRVFQNHLQIYQFFTTFSVLFSPFILFLYLYTVLIFIFHFISVLHSHIIHYSLFIIILPIINSSTKNNFSLFIFHFSFNMLERHPLTPFIHETTRILFLGSFPPPRKRWCMEFFYPNFINDHWRIQGLVFYNDKDHFVDVENKTFKINEIKDHCKRHAIGFFDTATAVIRKAGNASDKFLEIVEPTDIRKLVEKAPDLQALVTTGTKATETLCQNLGIDILPKVGEHIPTPLHNSQNQTIFLFRLPSSSRAYPLSLEKKAEAYKYVLKDASLSSFNS